MLKRANDLQATRSAILSVQFILTAMENINVSFVSFL